MKSNNGAITKVYPSMATVPFSISLCIIGHYFVVNYKIVIDLSMNYGILIMRPGDGDLPRHRLAREAGGIHYFFNNIKIKEGRCKPSLSPDITASVGCAGF